MIRIETTGKTIRLGTHASRDQDHDNETKGVIERQAINHHGSISFVGLDRPKPTQEMCGRWAAHGYVAHYTRRERVIFTISQSEIRGNNQ